MENLKFGLVILVMVVVAYFGFDAFFSLVGDLYTLLDGYIWAFFAGIIAFLASISIVVIMLQITLVCVALVLALLGALVR